MSATTRTLSAVLLATIVSLVATPSFAWTDGTVHMSDARAAALRECNARAEPYNQYDWGVTQLQIYRACMAEHHQPE